MRADAGRGRGEGQRDPEAREPLDQNKRVGSVVRKQAEAPHGPEVRGLARERVAGDGRGAEPGRRPRRLFAVAQVDGEERVAHGQHQVELEVEEQHGDRARPRVDRVHELLDARRAARVLERRAREPQQLRQDGRVRRHERVRGAGRVRREDARERNGRALLGPARGVEQRCLLALEHREGLEGQRRAERRAERGVVLAAQAVERREAPRVRGARGVGVGRGLLDGVDRRVARAAREVQGRQL